MFFDLCNAIGSQSRVSAFQSLSLAGREALQIVGRMHMGNIAKLSIDIILYWALLLSIGRYLT